MKNENTATFADAVIAWHEEKGRKDLPWQLAPDAYSVWVSEIMLQQTQVQTVIPYFVRFMAKFPDVSALANAEIDEVLHLWSGLGYYARARNLHQAAIRIRDEFSGRFPENFEQILPLPGIGRSTAGAILALAYEQPYAILDGNVKRVLARYFAIDGWPGKSSVQNELWGLAEALKPKKAIRAYTQGMMDLGATLCRRNKPECDVCPLQSECLAHQMARETAFPGKKPRRELPVRETQMLIVCTREGGVLLEQRPKVGIWGGLWSFPEMPVNEPPLSWPGLIGHKARLMGNLAERRHTFSHFHLKIHPVQILLEKPGFSVLEQDKRVWYNPSKPDNRGLASPVSQLLQEIKDQCTD